jgi:hypothetical protein
LKAWRTSHKPIFLLLGLGSGHLAGELARLLPEPAGLVVSEAIPENVRALLEDGRLTWWEGDGRTQILADSSIWAHFLLWHLTGLNKANTFTRINPETPPKRVEPYKRLMRIFNAAEPLLISSKFRNDGGLTFAAILSPKEPALAEFFRQIPPYCTEIVFVWDGEVPDVDKEFHCPVKHISRDLDGDFAAQRNAALKAASSDWVLFLDADERLTSGMWSSLPNLMAAAEVAGVNSIFFPRRTFYPDEQHVLAGYGLWPDLQLRLFRRSENLRFVNPVHEKLKGLKGPFGVVANGPILHYNRLLKDDEDVRRKLAGFDDAGGGDFKHHLSEEYPHMPTAFFPKAPDQGGLQVLVLPFDPA